MKFSLALLAVPVLGLAACGPAAPTLDRDDVAAFDATVADLNANTTRTPTQFLPFGTVTYDGQVGANILLDGASGYAMLGDLDMDVGFTGTRAIDGSVTGINLLRNGTPVETMGGQLDIAGQQASGKVDMAAEGILSRVTDLGVTQRTNMSMLMDGTVQTDRVSGDTIIGTVDPDSRGDGFGINTPSFNVDVLNGAFYAQD